ncbi:hypothetical protein QJ856_gp0278 [Tupanvirus deep ocean]|uniref:Uncharacterized protein n=2 Tax=Tupanvirus TaxID=2094720 RepID=A0AC62A9X8_9VIRU|nr:hypothetical protein QJ856_gp0278 [Tupanvirus deep ocean]QKU34455.1 hypothetical protein [Tupanvirus deep ocean]
MTDDICPICYDNLSNYDTTRLDCQHEFCDECLKKYINEKINERESSILCPIDMCDQPISNYYIVNLVSSYQYKTYKQNTQSFSSGTSHSMCPECRQICKKDEDNNRIHCSNCDRDYCYICQESHCWGYDDCPNERDINNTLDEIMSALGHDDVKPCPICRAIIYREEGCNSMRCKYCKVKFCWNCLETCSTINRMEEHACEEYNGYRETESDDEYVDGFDSD